MTRESVMARHRGSIVVNLLATLMMLEIAAVAAVAAYLVLTDTVTKDQVRLMYMAYNDEVTDRTVTDAEKWRVHQVEEEQKKQEVISGGGAKEKLNEANLKAEAEGLYLARQLKEMEDQRSVVQSLLKELDRKRELLAEQEKRIEDTIAAHASSGGQQGFQEMAAIMAKLKSSEIKDVLVGWDDQKAVAVLRALPGRVTAKVLGEFRTPREIQLKQRWLDMIGSGEIAAEAGGSK